MKITTWSVRAVASIVTILSFVFLTSNSMAAISPPTQGTELLARVKDLVDRGELFDPSVVLRKLGTAERPKTSHDVETTGECNPGLQRAFKITRVSLGSWYHNTPAGVPHMRYEKNGPFGHSGNLGDPDGTYQITDEEYCSDLLNLLLEKSAELRFANLPGFSCLTFADVTAIMPLTDDRAMDVGGIYSYSPETKREYGVRVTFGVDGSRCAEGFDVEQSQKLGIRYTQARQAFRQCTDVADHKFCASHAPFGWGDGHMQGVMAEFSAKQCGRFGLYYRRARRPDPRLVKPPSLAGPRTTPCDGK